MLNPIADLRQNYSRKELSEAEVNKDPIKQFELWFSEAVSSKLVEPNVMSLATATSNGKPSCRIVLLKAFDENGFVFFTNYKSKKGNELHENPFAALTFLWLELERQVRIEGTVEKLPELESDIYFKSRPEGSRIGAWTSPQSQPISKNELLDNERDFKQKYAGIEIPRPSFWGGYLVKPEMIEFWQGRPNRLHDRIVYNKTGESWKIERVAP